MIAGDEHAVLGRLAFGASPDSLSELRRLGRSRWIDRQLAPGEDAASDQRLATASLRIRYPAGDGYPALDEMRPLGTLSADIAELWPLADNKRPLAGPERQRPRQEVAAATILRAVHSPWQLREVMVDFWHNHFNVNATGDHAVAAALPAYDRVIRAHALGNFRDFLEAVAGSPAMLVYLNNRSSRAGNANENYGRELFELHGLGQGAYLNALYNRWREVPGALQGHPAGYIDQDVYEAARAFTGWTIEDGAGIGGGQRLPATGRFTYVEAWHDNYQKRVLATDFDPFQPPLADGRKVLDLIADHPATARFLADKLCRRLVADHPPEKLVHAAAAAWTAHRHHPDQIARVVEVIAKAPDAGAAAKIKRPLELVASFARGSGIALTPTDGLLAEMDGSGQRLFGWGPPNGHPDEMAYWLSSHVFRKRWTLMQGLAGNWWGSGLLAPSPADGLATAAEAAAYRHQELTGRAADPAVLAAMLEGAGLAPDLPLAGRGDDPHRRLLAFAAMTPAFNYR